MDEQPNLSAGSVDLAHVKREAWIEAYLTQSLSPDRAQQWEDLYFQSDEAAARMVEMLQLQACLASRNRRDERRREHKSSGSKRSRSRKSSSRWAYLPMAILGLGIACMLFFLGRAFWGGASVPESKPLPPVSATKQEIEALNRAVPSMSANPAQAPADLRQLAEFRPPPFPVLTNAKNQPELPSDDAFRKTMDRYLITKDYCRAALEFEKLPISDTTQFYAAASLLLCGRPAVAVPKLRAIGRAAQSIYAEEALLLVARSELKAYNYALATRELMAARALDGPNQAEISRMLKLLGEK
jgi:hypothetical protein